MTPADLLNTRLLYERGVPIASIARSLGLPRDRVRDHLRGLGILRPAGFQHWTPERRRAYEGKRLRAIRSSPNMYVAHMERRERSRAGRKGARALSREHFQRISRLGWAASPAAQERARIGLPRHDPQRLSEWGRRGGLASAETRARRRVEALIAARRLGAVVAKGTHP